MPTRDQRVLVTGATGTQGGATARELLAAGFRVRVLTRNPDSPAAQALAGLGAEIGRGDMEDAQSLDAATKDAHGVFSVQRPEADGSDSERRHGLALIAAARRSGVRHFVHTSVCEAGRHTAFPRWESGYWWQKYWTDKWDLEEAVRAAGFANWTVLKPAFMMDNFAQPKGRFMFPHLTDGRILTAFAPTTRLQLIAGDDVGAFARAALVDPGRFHHRDIELAAEALTMTEVAATLSRVLGKPVEARSVTPAQAKAGGLFPGWVRSQEWTNEVGYRADIAALAQYGVPMTRFVDWIDRHAGEITIRPGGGALT
ncbi:MAG: NmrA/HSCARG family protein [Steroidobacteraceae bacterium]